MSSDTSYALGYVPSGVTVHLTRNADFIQSLSTVDGSDWPDGTIVQLTLDGSTTWEATVDGPDVVWNVDKVDVEAFRATTESSRSSAVLTYSDGAGVDLVWMTGRVQWHG